MANALDLESYLDRVNWRGQTARDYATLAGLLDAHLAHIPFENFDVLLGRPVRLDLEGLQSKLVKSRRGGYCFEHATLFAAALERIGFEPVRHVARVIVFQPPSRSPRTHMFLTVDVDGARFVVDPGFGPFASRLPVPLDAVGVPPDRPTHRVGRDGGHWVMHCTRDGAQLPGWISTLEAEHPVDFEMANHFTSTHPGSRFVNGIVASAVTSEGRVQCEEPRCHGACPGENRDVSIAPPLRAARLVDRAFRLRSPGSGDNAGAGRTGVGMTQRAAITAIKQAAGGRIRRTNGGRSPMINPYKYCPDRPFPS